jgi:hypothetical protein
LVPPISTPILMKFNRNHTIGPEIAVPLAKEGEKSSSSGTVERHANLLRARSACLNKELV